MKKRRKLTKEELKEVEPYIMLMTGLEFMRLGIRTLSKRKKVKKK